jgi:hypothetical protein
VSSFLKFIQDLEVGMIDIAGEEDGDGLSFWQACGSSF